MTLKIPVLGMKPRTRSAPGPCAATRTSSPVWPFYIRSGVLFSALFSVESVFIAEAHGGRTPSVKNLRPTCRYCAVQVPIGCHPVLLASFTSRAAT
jgi:hypothetical protein